MTLDKVKLAEFEKALDDAFSNMNNDLFTAGTTASTQTPKINYKDEAMKAGLKLAFEAAKEKAVADLVTATLKRVKGVQRIPYEDLDSAIARLAPSELAGEVKKAVIRYMVYEEKTRTHVVIGQELHLIGH
jgi:hypothetical protein